MLRRTGLHQAAARRLGDGGSSGAMGSDVFIPVLNGAGNPVYGAELVTDLPVATPGNETGRFRILIRKNGTLIGTITVGADTFLVPLGSSHSVLGWAFNGDATAQGTGCWWEPVGGQWSFDIASTLNLALLQGSLVSLFQNTATLRLGTINQIILGLVGTHKLQASAQFGNVMLSRGIAVATNATENFVELPSGAGPPTGNPSSSAFSAPAAVSSCVYEDTTNHKAWRWEAPTTRWYCRNRCGKGADVASAGTLVIAAGDRPAYDYFRVTGSTAVDFISYSAADLYAPIGDGEVLELYCLAGTTFNNGTGGPPANAYSLQLTSGAATAIAANKTIRFRRDVALTRFVQV